MAKLDAEDILAHISALLQDATYGVNARIAAIESEKGALSPTLETIVGYREQAINQGILKDFPSVYYGLEKVDTIDGGMGIAKNYTIFCVVVTVDNGMTNDFHKRMLRYVRALEEVFTAPGAFKSGNFSRIKIETLIPVSIRLEEDSSDEMKVGGVSITLSLG